MEIWRLYCENVHMCTGKCHIYHFSSFVAVRESKNKSTRGQTKQHTEVKTTVHAQKQNNSTRGEKQQCKKANTAVHETVQDDKKNGTQPSKETRQNVLEHHPK